MWITIVRGPIEEPDHYSQKVSLHTYDATINRWGKYVLSDAKIHDSARIFEQVFVPDIQDSDIHVENMHSHEGEGHKNRSNTNRNSVSRWLNKMILLDHLLDSARCV